MYSVCPICPFHPRNSLGLQAEILTDGEKISRRTEDPERRYSAFGLARWRSGAFYWSTSHGWSLSQRGSHLSHVSKVPRSKHLGQVPIMASSTITDVASADPSIETTPGSAYWINCLTMDLKYEQSGLTYRVVVDVSLKHGLFLPRYK